MPKLDADSQLVNPIIEAFGQQSRLPAIRPLNETLSSLPPAIQPGNP